MNFKKYSDMELALLSAIANLTAEDVEDIAVEKGDISFASMEGYNSVPSYLHKPNAKAHAMRRKATFKKKVEQKDLAHDLGYDLSTENNSKKVKDLLSSNHSDRFYMSGDKSFKKHPTLKEEATLMEKENLEKAREDMMEYHNYIWGAIAQDVDDLNMDLKSSVYSIENLKLEYKELEEAMKVVSEKLKNAYLRKNGIQAALLQKEEELDALSANLKKERISHFGW